MIVDTYRKVNQFVKVQGGRNKVLTLNEFRQELSELIKSDTLAVRMLITPEMAEIMMERNESEEWKNRHKSENSCRRIARAINEGRWMYTGEPIIFSASGRMLNGQHRLSACMLAKEPIDVLVVFGVADTAFKYMDIGTKRAAAHIFGIEGIPNYTFAAAATRIVYYYLKNESWSGNVNQGLYTVDNDELLEIYYRHTGIQRSHGISDRVRKAGIIPQRWAGALHYLCSLKDQYKADEFFYQLATGIGIENEKSAIFNVRDRLLGKSSSRKHEREPEVNHAAYIVQAWNAWRNGNPRKLFRWRSEQHEKDGKAEPFPRIQ